MAHVRTQIRGAVKAAVTGLATTGNRVFEGRVYPMQAAELPGLLVYTEDEQNSISGKGVARTSLRDLEVVIEGVFKDNASLDDKADVILKEVEVALGPGVALGGGKYAHLARVEIERSDTLEKPAASMRMVFEIPYLTAHGAPESAL